MEQLTLSLEEVPANPSPSQRQQTATAWMENLASCSNIYDVLTRFDLGGSSGRTSQAYSVRKTMLSDSSWIRWEKSGIKTSHTEFLMLNSSEWPSDADVCMLSDILEDVDSVPQRFYLSKDACRGIIRRVEKRDRALPEPLKSTLEAIANR